MQINEPDPFSVQLHTMNSAATIRRLTVDGWKQVHVAGSHHKFKHPDKPSHVVVPHPKPDRLQRTVRNICRQAGWRDKP